MATNSSFRTLTLSNIEGIAEEKNYLKSNFENASTAGWNKFTTTLTGGVPTGSLTVGTAASITAFNAYAVNPLTGKLSLWVNSVPTGWVAGQGIISDVITIDRQDQAKVLNITFDYEPIQNPSSINFSGVLGQQTFAIYVYDVTASAWVQPAGFLSMTGRGISTARATFQTAMVAGQQYRVAIVCLQTTPSVAIGMLFDNFQMTRSNYIYGTPVTDWQDQSSSFTISGDSGATRSIYTRRVGDTLHIRGTITASSPAASTFSINLPSQYVIDYTKNTTTTNVQIVGNCTIEASSSAAFTAATSGVTQIFTDGTNTGSLFVGFGYGSNQIQKNQASQFLSSGNRFSFLAQVPISGWSSSVQTSDSADTRVVAARATKSANQNIATTAATTITWNTYTIDTHGGFSGNTYTIPVSGFYRISLTIDAFNITAGASGYFNSIITKNGSSLQGQYFYVASSGDQIATNTGIFQFVAGDQITATVASPDGNYTIRANDCFISIERLSGPSAIAASETVAASYHLSSNQSVSTTVRYNFDAKIFDTHNAVTTGASWVFTAPISGKYEIWINSYASSSSYNNYIYKNGSQFQYINDGINGKSASGNVMIDLIAGDTVHARPNTSITAQGGNLITGYTIIGIKRIGN